MKGIILSSKSKAQVTSNDHSLSRFLEAAEKKNIELDIVPPNQFELIVTRADERSLLINDKPTEFPDFVIPRMGAETTYYGLAVIRQLEHLGVYVCNNARAIETVKDKLHIHQVLAHSRLPTPKTMLAKLPIDPSLVKREIGFPLVIKNVTGAQGKGIYLCESQEKFTDVMELVFSNNPKANIIIQKFIEPSRGKDLRVFVLGGRVIGCMQRSSQTSFKANFSKGGQVSPFALTPEIEWLATETARLVNLDIAGIDLLFDGDGFKICEANSAPGFNGLEQVVGKHIAEDILDYVSIKVGQNKAYEST
jgi:gamma-F420-2:alpha-L-glutamate ligase